MENEKRKRKLTFKKANLTTWCEDKMDFSDEEEKDEKALLCLMAFDDEANEVLDFNLSCSSNDDDDMDGLYLELYDSLVRGKKELKLKIIENESLLEMVRCLENDNHGLNLLVEQLLT